MGARISVSPNFTNARISVSPNFTNARISVSPNFTRVGSDKRLTQFHKLLGLASRLKSQFPYRKLANLGCRLPNFPNDSFLAFWLLRGFGTGLISQASHLLTFAILGVGHGLILQLGKRETLHFGPIGAGGPKNAVSLFPNCNIGS